MSKNVYENRLIDVFESLSVELKGVRVRDEIHQFSIDRLDQRMRKRAEIRTEDLSAKALAGFRDTNKVVASSSINLDNDVINNARLFITSVLERFTSRVNPLWVQESLDLSYLLDQWRFGPGASNGVQGTHTAEKIYSDMTCTSSCVPLVVQLRLNNIYLTQFDLRNENDGITVIQGSRLTTVPKNEETERVIAIEPSGNMALQLAAGRYLENVLRSIGLDISTQQEKNKALARIGSIDNSLATIDLKSASDMISIDLVRCLLPTSWYNLLMKIRSPYTKIDEDQVELSMISTMGNGFTFPLMTLILVSLIYALRCRNNGPTLYVSWEKTAVFGDDIIVPTEEYEPLCTILTQAGLIVNKDKSYSDGPFRESCGGDYYNGVDVTPFYIRSLKTISDVYIVINQVLDWCAKVNTILPKTLLLLRTYIPGVPFFVPEWSNPDQGILTQWVPTRYKFLQPQPKKLKLSDEHFAMPLICGGYIESVGPNLCYTPRLFEKTKVLVRRGRLPKGFSSGWDPLKRSSSKSLYVASYVDLLFNVN